MATREATRTATTVATTVASPAARPARRPIRTPPPIAGLRRIVRTLVCIVVLSALATLASGPPNRFVDPEGRFEVEVPTGWRVEIVGDAVRLADPDGGIAIHLVVVDGDRAEPALQRAWRRVDAAFAETVRGVVRPPAPEGIDEVVCIDYDVPTDRVALAMGQRSGGRVYALLLEASLDAYARRQAQVATVASSFAVAGLGDDDLSSTSPRPFDAALADDLDRFVVAAMDAAGVPGATVAVVQNGSVVHVGAYGVKRLGLDAPMTPSTQLMIGSAGKTLTTLMMAALVDDGRLRWDDPVADVWPAVRLADAERSEALRVRHLVCACSGVPRHDLEILFGWPGLSAEQVVGSLATFEPYTELGEAYQYSNQMVATGGYLAAVADGGDPGALLPAYASSLQRHVLSPIGMRDTTLSFLAVEARGDHATPHGRALDGSVVPLPLAYERILVPVAPSGGHWSTVSDLSRYLATLMAGGIAPDGTRVVSTGGLDALLEPQVRVSADLDYGLGWMIGRWHGVRYASHAGNTFGFTSALTFLPDHGVGVVVLVNARAANAFAEAVAFRTFDRLFGRSVEQTEDRLAFSLELAEHRHRSAEAGLADDLSQLVLIPYAGRWLEPRLGSLELGTDEHGPWAAVGDARVRIRRTRTPEPRSCFVALDPPLTGVRFDLERSRDGVRTVTIRTPTDTYRFVRP